MRLVEKSVTSCWPLSPRLCLKRGLTLWKRDYFPGIPPNPVDWPQDSIYASGGVVYHSVSSSNDTGRERVVLFPHKHSGANEQPIANLQIILVLL
jgi:hypothetical protein